MIGQQLTRFASGRLRQSHEVLQLEEVLKSVLALRTRETQARGIALKPQLKSARVIVDGSLLFSLLNATLDWALANAACAHRFHDRLQDLAGARAADLPLRASPGRQADDRA